MRRKRHLIHLLPLRGSDIWATVERARRPEGPEEERLCVSGQQHAWGHWGAHSPAHSAFEAGSFLWLKPSIWVGGCSQERQAGSNQRVSIWGRWESTGWKPMSHLPQSCDSGGSERWMTEQSSDGKGEDRTGSKSYTEQQEAERLQARPDHPSPQGGWWDHSLKWGNSKEEILERCGRLNFKCLWQGTKESLEMQVWIGESSGLDIQKCMWTEESKGIRMDQISLCIEHVSLKTFLPTRKQFISTVLINGNICTNNRFSNKSQKKHFSGITYTHTPIHKALLCTYANIHILRCIINYKLQILIRKCLPTP